MVAGNCRLDRQILATVCIHSSLQARVVFLSSCFPIAELQHGFLKSLHYFQMDNDIKTVDRPLPMPNSYHIFYISHQKTFIRKWLNLLWFHEMENCIALFYWWIIISVPSPSCNVSMLDLIEERGSIRNLEKDDLNLCSWLCFFCFSFVRIIMNFKY